MAAQVELHGQIQNWERIKSFFRESEEENSISTTTTITGDGWDNNDDWGDWPKDDADDKYKDKGKFQAESMKERTKDKDEGSSTENKSWFDDYIFANSPAGDIFVVANGPKAVFLTSEWDMEKSRMKYNISYEGTLAQEEGEYITSIACTPLISKKKSSPGVPDWSCIIVGFNRGYVRIYTEHGNTLLSQQFHTQRIIGFKLRSYVPSSVYLQHAQMEEVIILYRRVIVTIDGFGLFQTLRACRNNLAKVKANLPESGIEPPPLSYKKWAYDNEQTTHDCEIIGLNTPSSFDHLFNASLLGGMNAKCKQKPPTSSIFVSTGQKPFVAFHYAQEGSATPVISDIAYAVASKVKSSIITAASGWLGFGSSASAKPSSSDKAKTEIVPPTLMSCRFALPDVRRVGKSIIMSPCRKLSVITDHLGRIILIDNKLGIAIRIWKGYRDAECSWLLVDEDSSSSRSKHKEKEIRSALFLVVYVPRRGQVEVFAMQQGPKVATFNVSKHGRLLSTTYAMMGINDVYMRGGNRPTIQCVFVDSEANIFTFNIPFHLGLCDKSSCKVKDLHLLKSVQRLLREEKYDVNSVLDLVLDIQTSSMINQSFKMLIHKCRKADILSSVIQTYLEKFSDDKERDLALAFQLQSLMELYEYLLDRSSFPPPYQDSTFGELNSNKDILFCLHATEKEMNTLSEMAKKYVECKAPGKTVSFGNADSISVNAFFSSLMMDFDVNKGKQEKFSVQINFKCDEVDDFGVFIFCGCLNGTSNLSEWKQKIQNASLNSSELLKLAFIFWSRNSLLSSCYYSMMEKLYHLLKVLCDIEGYESVVSEFSQVSKWWETIRKDLTKSADIFQIYSFALVCRGVAIDLQQQKESQGFKTPEKEQLIHEESSETAGPSSKIPQDDWEFENMSMDLLKWNLLIKQIEDLFLLSSVLMQRPKLENPKLPTLDIEIEPLSVINLLDRGKGCIAELVGKWLTSIGIDPALISDPEPEPPITTSYQSSKSTKENVAMDIPDIHKDTTEEGVEASEAEKSTNYVLDLIMRLKENFSVSLSSSIILSNYCWEYCLEFNKETRHLEFFESAISCAGAISSPFVRLGMISMIWSTFISKKLAALTSRSKTGKDMPLEKMSGFASSEKKQEFLRLCVEFLDLYMEASVSCIGIKPPKNTSFRNHWSTDTNINASLADLALVQPVPNYEKIILLHYQLALCSHFYHSFRIKKSSLKPIEMFDTKSRMLLFSPMCNTASYSNVEVDLALKMLREEFLCLVISNAIHGIPEELDSSIECSDFTTIIPDTEGVKICDHWIQKCFELGRIWGLDLDGLRINQVCEFYSNGLDLLGLELIGTVSGRDILGARLLVIAGMRISYIINLKRENVTEILSSLSTNLSNWLDSLDYSVLRCLRFSKTSIVELAQQVIQLIPETSYDYKLAEELLMSSSFL